MKPVSLVFFAAILLASLAALNAAEPLLYSRDIRPILSDHCFACHGPDTANQQAGLRLDVREAAMQPADSGDPAIIPGKADASALVARILSEDEYEIMPPADSHQKLSALQKETLRQWVAEGAEYEPHWAFVPPEKSSDDNSIDDFIRTELQKQGLPPSPPASRETLIRRLALDLTGLPPNLSDQSSDISLSSYIDRLLASPHYGEHMAVGWLDAARFADTNGYQVDRDRELWPWRDWVINAFNANMPFDQFTIEQLAGDLLPSATLDQKIATGFHRNHMFNEEGGIIAEEFLAEYTADRVETTAAVWLGQTFNCNRCHDHKFDPFTQRDFYAMKAFFHNVPERGVGIYSNPIRTNAPPFIPLPTPELEAEIAALNARLDPVADNLKALTAGDIEPGATELVAIAAKKEALRTEVERKQLADFHLERMAEHHRLSAEATALKNQIAAKEAEIPTTLVMEEQKEPRPTFILMRGAYDKPGEIVTAATPAVLPPLAADLPRNRLGLARWLVSPENPLTARVIVNRIWQHFFAVGLVRTSEDFGSQGALPSHPELLDWLAVTFQESGWDVKKLVKRIVTSETYQQNSQFSVRSAQLDPMNQFLSRGPRHRLGAEVIRDQALAASGLLVTKIGGPSVKPYHPPGLYEQVVAQRDNPKATYQQGGGDDLHRRSLYTYWKRSVPHPGMLLFDAPFREACTLRRSRSNTPLQALNLLNDPTYVEAARHLAQRMIQEGGPSAESRLAHGFRILLARNPSPEELQILTAARERSLKDFTGDPAAAKQFLAVGEAGTDEKLSPAELAAYTTLASTLINLDETITKE